MTRLPRFAAVLALSVLAALLAPAAAHAVGYQFWGFYQLSDDGEWSFATEGPATVVPEDGTVEGFRFAVSSGEDVRVPRAVLTFEEICADTPAEDGMKRVGLVVDPGRDVDAPQGETLFTPGAQCVVADPGATSQEVVDQAAGEVRVVDAFLCGIGGFPAEGGCGDEVAEPTPEQLAEDEEIAIPVVPAGQPIIAAADQDGEATDEPTATDDATATDESTEDATTEEATDEATDEETTEEATEEATEEDTAEATPDEGADEATDEDSDGSSGGVPPWVWIAGAVVLLGLLAWAAGAARNRRLEDAERDWAPDDQDAKDPDGPQGPDGDPGPGGPPGR
ncbi:SCO2322 family protein [Ornithinimicrobium sp. F0845]|uniref:SCO2322 family protein n=1 Tax=Ornithinimicrobium sp. F0845 TaxID=2926412 RepID=UPI001FF21841|nr:SCO2322 family protein [Ornithinimicrobium sp. F0845]MCK0113982.1 SCO2322 family protein [Ornithinimicrobium sp. F0845]